MTNSFHPTAIISEKAQIDKSSYIGPFCVIGPNVKIGKNCKLISNITIEGNSTIGKNCQFFPFSVIGMVPQDLKFKGESTALTIGKRNRIREHVTINTGTAGGGGLTKVGNDCLMMAGCHIAHDVQVSDRVIIVNSAAIAGHVIIEEDVIVGGLCGVHQFVRLG